MKKRNLLVMILLSLVTFGIYCIYWSVTTKTELKKISGEYIPTAFICLIPFGVFYFWYKYAQVYTKTILKDTSESAVIIHLLLLSLLFPVGMLIVQDHYNDYQQ